MTDAWVQSGETVFVGQWSYGPYLNLPLYVSHGREESRELAAFLAGSQQEVNIHRPCIPEAPERQQSQQSPANSRLIYFNTQVSRPRRSAGGGFGG